jgi:4-amino-4-deoxy-L-arabinose transferase-like glycosyltransferase
MRLTSSPPRVQVAAMLSTTRHILLIVIVGVVVLFSNLGGPRLWDRDEPRNAGCTREMLARGDWITPVFDGELRTHKPILLYWLMMTAYSLFGVNEFAARFWSATSAIGTALLTYGIGRRMFSSAVGLWAAVILMTTLMFDVAARAATPDAILMFWSTAAIAVYVGGTRISLRPRHDGTAVAVPGRLFPTWPVAALMYGCMGMAALAKGPVGVVLPTAVIGMYLLIQRLPSRLVAAPRHDAISLLVRVRSLLRPFAPRHFLGTCWSMRPVTALIVLSVVALPWYGVVAWRTEGQWVRGFVMDHNVGRAAQSLEGHSGSVLYYPLALLVGFFPWSVFAIPTALEIVHRLRSQATDRAAHVLALSWLGVYVGLFSIAQTKLPSYITPSYPAVALLVAHFIAAWSAGASRVASVWCRAAFACLGIVGVIVLVAIPVAATRYLPGEQWLAGLGLVPLLSAGVGLVLIRRDARTQAAVVFAAGAIALATGMFTVGAARVDSHQTFDTFVQVFRQRSPRPRIGTLGVAEPSWVFYTGRPMDRLVVPETLSDMPRERVMSGTPPKGDWQPKPSWNAWDYLSQSPDHYAITSAQYLKSIGGLPSDVEVLARTPYFLQDDMLLLLAARASVAQTTGSGPEAGHAE